MISGIRGTRITLSLLSTTSLPTFWHPLMSSSLWSFFHHLTAPLFFELLIPVTPKTQVSLSFRRTVTAIGCKSHNKNISSNIRRTVTAIDELTGWSLKDFASRKLTPWHVTINIGSLPLRYQTHKNFWEKSNFKIQIPLKWFDSYTGIFRAHVLAW